jgi:hypothetical protein
MKVRVARVDELAPGQGKVVDVGGRDVAVYNLEGRLYAVASRFARAPLAGACEPACPSHGRRFAAAAHDSPARLRDESEYRVVIEGEFVVVVDARGAHATTEE